MTVEKTGKNGSNQNKIHERDWKLSVKIRYFKVM